MLSEERELGDLPKYRCVMAEGGGVTAVAKPTVVPRGRLQIDIVVVMPGHLLDGMPLGQR